MRNFMPRAEDSKTKSSMVCAKDDKTAILKAPHQMANEEDRTPEKFPRALLPQNDA